MSDSGRLPLANVINNSPVCVNKSLLPRLKGWTNLMLQGSDSHMLLKTKLKQKTWRSATTLPWALCNILVLPNLSRRMVETEAVCRDLQSGDTPWNWDSSNLRSRNQCLSLYNVRPSSWHSYMKFLLALLTTDQSLRRRK